MVDVVMLREAAARLNALQISDRTPEPSLENARSSKEQPKFDPSERGSHTNALLARGKTP